MPKPTRIHKIQVMAADTLKVATLDTATLMATTIDRCATYRGGSTASTKPLAPTGPKAAALGYVVAAGIDRTSE